MLGCTSPDYRHFTTLVPLLEQIDSGLTALYRHDVFKELMFCLYRKQDSVWMEQNARAAGGSSRNLSLVCGTQKLSRLGTCIEVLIQRNQRFQDACRMF